MPTFFCTPCHNKDNHDVEAEWMVWPKIESTWVPYTYMCTDCACDAIHNGMSNALRPGDVYPVQQITHIRSVNEAAEAKKRSGQRSRV